jgi:hypothetical protein
MNKKQAFLAITFLAALQAAALTLPEFIREPVWQSGFYLKNTWIGNSRTMLLALPNVYSFALSERLGVDAATTAALANSNFANSSILRLANSKLRLSYNYRDFLMGTFGVRLPLWRNQFSGEQLITAGDIGARQLNFQNSSLFNSLDFFGGLSSSLAFKDVGDGDLSLGLGLSYYYKGAYTPVEGTDIEFNPGNEFNMSLASEYAFRAFERKITAMADIGFTFFGADQYGSTQEISVGSKFNWALFMATEITEVFPVSVRLANYRKGANENPGRYGETSKKASDLVFTAMSGIPFFTDYRPYAKLSLAGYSGGGSPAADNDAFIVTLGGGASYRLSEHIFADGELGFDMGALGKSGVFGFDLSSQVHYKF